MTTKQDLSTSNCLNEYKKFDVDILSRENTTTYYIRQTQGAEFGAEAERVRRLFQKVLNDKAVTFEDATVEAFQSFLDTDCSELPNDRYKDLLYEIIDECKTRIQAMDEDEQ